MQAGLFPFGLVPPGLIELLTTLLEDGREEDQIYMCGPLPFMDLVRDNATGLGWSPEQIHFEHFTAAPPELSLDGDDFVL